MTPTELKHTVLRKLKVINSEEFANPADFVLMTQKYEGVYAMLLEMSLVTWALTENIPVKCEQPLLQIVAAYSVDDFGIPGKRGQDLKAEGMLKLPNASPAERALRALLAKPPVQSTARAEYF